MEIEFFIDDVTGQPHIWAHGVSEAEVIEIFEHAPLVLHARQGAYMALGQTSAGRYLKVIHRRREGTLFVITAYDLRGNALRAFRKRKRRKQS